MYQREIRLWHDLHLCGDDAVEVFTNCANAGVELTGKLMKCLWRQHARVSEVAFRSLLDNRPANGDCYRSH